MHTFEMPHRCPFCNFPHECVTALIDANRPKPGDLAVCFHCASICVVTITLSLRKPDPAELRHPSYADVLPMALRTQRLTLDKIAKDRARRERPRIRLRHN